MDSFLILVRGLVRPFIAASFIVMTAYLVYIGKIDAKDILTILLMIVAFYFGERSALKTPGVVEQPKPNGGPEAPK